jgi:hypothetical protein
VDGSDGGALWRAAAGSAILGDFLVTWRRGPGSACPLKYTNARWRAEQISNPPGSSIPTMILARADRGFIEQNERPD